MTDIATSDALPSVEISEVWPITTYDDNGRLRYYRGKGYLLFTITFPGNLRVYLNQRQADELRKQMGWVFDILADRKSV